ncbi:MAG: SDR family NAD(P)-dependent oxidoreductase, partial [Gammaproteobacteria bacterium]
MQLRSLKDSVAVVTGASSGIGEAAARALADEGVNVVLAARSKEHIEALARDLGGAALAVPTDVSDPGQVARLFARVQAEFGGLDLLFNNAGVGYHGRFETSD